MSYTYNLSPASSFEDRYSQFIAFGIPKADVDTLRATIKDMWADAPGGWSYEWSAFARKYLSVGNSLLASFAARPNKKRSDARHQRRKRLFRPAGGYARLQRSPQNRSPLATGHWTLCRVGWRLEAAGSN